MNSIGIDIGGTNIKGVLIDQSGIIIHSTQRPTFSVEERDWRENVRIMARELLKVSGSGPCVIGISAPGLVNATNTAISFMPGRLNGLENTVWTDYLGHNCHVINDAHAALLAESHFGAGRGCRHLAMLTLGTGVGGALLIDGHIYQGSIGRAGHLGHISINSHAEPGITNSHGSLEDAVGNASLSRRSYGRYHNTDDLLRDYRNGFSFASYIWLSMVRNLAAGISSIINAFSPEKIILSGGITNAGKDLFNPLEEFMDVYEWRPGGFKTPIEVALHREYAGALGAAAFGLDRAAGLTPRRNMI